MAGLVGAGRTEIARAIFGADPLYSGTVELNGAPIKIKTPKDAVSHRIGYLSEDRKSLGLVLSKSVKFNTTLSSLEELSNCFGMIIFSNQSSSVKEQNQVKKNLNSGTKQIVFMFLALAAIFLIFATIAPNFLTWKNMNGILLATMINGVLAVGITFALIGGGIDLSVGTGMTFGSVMIAIYITRAHMAVPLAILCGLLTCAGYGLINGLGIAKIKIPPFIMTLGMMMVTKGLSLILTGSRPVYLNEYPGFCALATGSVIDSLIGVNLPNGFILLLILAAISHIILSHSTFGRYIYAIGSNEEATRLSGINVDKWKMLIYVTTGFFAGLAGLLMSSRLSSAQPALGSGYEMDAIAAAIIGGASTRGGEGTIIGTIVGAFIISVLTNGLRMMSVATEWQTVLTGVVVILAVCVDVLRKKSQA